MILNKICLKFRRKKFWINPLEFQKDQKFPLTFKQLEKKNQLNSNLIYMIDNNNKNLKI